MPLMTAEIKWFKSPKVGLVNFNVLKQMSYNASLSKTMHSSAFSTNWWIDNVALYGSTTVSETFGDGTTENVNIILSGYSSRILEINNVPIPEPVPPPNEWHTWKPCKQSQLSASFLTTSKTESINSAPSV